ncbi:phage holin family protein [Bacteroides finegoldii]|uniref:phage holin family protein n=1 Tax=Bacteroides finegoldii TaxID=338188 RepID=UPI00265CF3F8|nr:phage holin family protein [Bacteroides finegoldii]
MVKGQLTRTISSSVFVGELYALMWDMRWLMLFILILIIVDMWYGVSKSIKRGEEFRKSRCVKRFLLKCGDYICLLILGAVLGKAIGEPLGVSALIVSVIVVLIGCLAELESIKSNYCETKGIHKDINVFKLLLVLIGFKSKELEKALEESITDKEKNNESDK